MEQTTKIRTLQLDPQLDVPTTQDLLCCQVIHWRNSTTTL